MFAAITFAAFSSSPEAQASPNPTNAVPAYAARGTGGRPSIRQMKTDGGVISASDVENFVQLEGMPRTVGPRSPMTDIHATLLTSAQISTLLKGENTGFADNTLLWFVEMRGTFVFPGPANEPSVIAHVGYQIFDPVTGDRVMFGGLDAKRG